MFDAGPENLTRKGIFFLTILQAQIDTSPMIFDQMIVHENHDVQFDF